jgi:hypothetical protein
MRNLPNWRVSMESICTRIWPRPKTKNSSACSVRPPPGRVHAGSGLGGEDVWFAHAVWVNDEEIGVFAKHNCGVAHCPTSNMRLASGIAPIKEYRAAGVNVGLGVDGSASNDGSHLLAEVRNAMLLQSLGTTRPPVFECQLRLLRCAPRNNIVDERRSECISSIIRNCLLNPAAWTA